MAGGDDKRSSAPSIASDLARALDDEVRRIVDIKLRGWQILGAFVVAVSLAMMTIFNQQPRGMFPLFGGAALVAWATFERWGARTKGWRWMMPVHVAIEVSIPWLMLLFITLKVGPQNGLHAWSPVLLFGAVTLMSVVHLRPMIPLVSAVAGVAQYALIYLLFIEPHIAAGEMPRMEISPEHPAGRCIQVLMVGVVAAFVAAGLRKAVGGAARTVRQRDLFGKYKLEREIARGGMGVVHKATYCPEGGFRRPVAVKLIHTHLAKEERFVDAFRNEAELCARLLHHNIVQVLDFGKVQDTYFIAMELVDGMTCRDVFKRARHAKVRTPPRVVAAIAHAILCGLYHAHREALDDNGKPMHVIHRDLGLENILIHHTGVVKVTDFGIARALKDSQSTMTGTVVGHSDHMAPEQANAEALDERCDLFCVGIIVWELLCGEPLFTRNSDAASLIAILQAPVAPPSTIDPALAPWDAFLERALARAKERRFESAKEMADALEPLKDGAGAADVARFVASLPSVPPVDVVLRLEKNAAAIQVNDQRGVDTAATTIVDGVPGDAMTHSK